MLNDKQLEDLSYEIDDFLVKCSNKYKVVDEKVCALFQRDDKAAEPLRAALVAKYSKSQEKANA